MADDLHHAIQAAGRALLPWADDEDAGALFEWHPCDECPHPDRPCACSGQPWPSEAVQAAIKAAAPHLHADLQQRLEQLQRVANAAGVLWHSQNALAPTPEKIRHQEWTVVEVGRDAMAALGDALDLAASATPEVSDG